MRHSLTIAVLMAVAMPVLAQTPPAPQAPSSQTSSELAPSLVNTPPARPSFDSEPHPAAPNYAEASNWVLNQAGKKNAPVDVFYVYPTTYPGPHWNQDVADPVANAKTDGSVIVTQAMAFADCCRLYAPRYRQAAGQSLAVMNGDGGKAFNLAYGDVLQAFEYYLKHDNHGRPFILAGHSQGTYHLIRLLGEDIIGKPVQKQLVAAYLVGIGISEGLIAKGYKVIKYCAKPTETGCLISWNTDVKGTDTKAYLDRSEARYVDKYGDDPSKKLLCINPLTFDYDKPNGGPATSVGALTGPAVNGALPPLKDKSVSATCSGGLLYVDPATDPAMLNPMPGGSLHMQDVELFYGNIKANAAARVKAWMLVHN